MEKIAEGIWKIEFGTPEYHTPFSMRESEIRRKALAEMAGEKKPYPPFSEEQIEFTLSRRGVTLTLPMENDEDFFGFGLQLLSVNYAGRRRYIKVNSDPRTDTGEGHAPVPFYVSTAGYGLFVDTFRYTTFLMGTNAEKGASAHIREVNQTHTEFSESALYALKKAKERRRIVIDVPAAGGVNLYLFAGNLLEAVQRYNLFSGGGCLPPMWGLGMWYRVYGGSNEEHILKLAEEFRKERMPVDVIGIEPGWHSHSYACTYEWGSLFPTPDEMVSGLCTKGYHINLWEHAFIYPAAQFYEAMLPYSGDYEVWNGLVPDFATPQARQIFSGYHEKNFVEKGISGFKLDECDNSDFNPSNWSFPDSTRFPSGMDGEQMHNALGVLYQQTLTDVFRKQNKRTLSQVRSSGALASSLPFVLYSDLYSHKEFIRGIVTAPFSGILWAAEVRDCANANDLLRRVQTICFSSHALLNCWRIPNPPWKQVDIEKNLRNEVMENAAQYTDECRRLFELRMSLLPYLYSAFAEYYEKGIPPIRPLCMEYPEDPGVRNLDDEYFFGKDMLVCPLTLEQGTQRQVYLPQGKWYDFFTGQEYAGGRQFTVKAEWEEIPVFVRDGAIIPLAAPEQFVGENTVFSLHVKLFGNNPGEFTLYEDDFTSWNYEKEGFHRIHFTKDGAGRLTADGMENSVKYKWAKETEENE